MNDVDFQNGYKKIKNSLLAIQNEYEKIFILGFSIGATIAWLCSEESCVAGVVGFYGSRIRDYTTINPICPTLLFFPEIEKSFQVNELVSTLDKPNVKIQICKGEHGFSDSYAVKYKEEIAQSTFKETVRFFNEN